MDAVHRRVASTLAGALPAKKCVTFDFDRTDSDAELRGDAARNIDTLDLHELSRNI